MEGINENPNLVANYMATGSSLIVAKRYPEAATVCDEGISFAKDLIGRIWCIFFEMITKSFQGSLLNSFGDDINVCPNCDW